MPSTFTFTTPFTPDDILLLRFLAAMPPQPAASTPAALAPAPNPLLTTLSTTTSPN